MINSNNSVIYTMEKAFPFKNILSKNQIKRLTNVFKKEQYNFYFFAKTNIKYNIIIDFKNVYVSSDISNDLVNTIIHILEKIKKETNVQPNVTVVNSSIDSIFNNKINKELNTPDNFYDLDTNVSSLLNDIDNLINSNKEVS